ncbi:MAG: hypothetical protein ACXW0Q_15760, partial [Methylovulum sp.]
MLTPTELRPKIRQCLNVLDATKPIVFGDSPLIEGGVDESYYVEGLHGGGRALVQVMADRIDFDEGGGTYLFSGNRGTGKTTELMRLAQLLHQQDCQVFYVDMAEYLNLTVPVEITDFLICLLGGLSEKFEQKFGHNPSNRSFFERVWDFLQSEVKLEGLDLEAGGDVKASLKMSLRENPTFKQKLQEGTRGYVARLVQEARRFVEDLIADARKQTDPDKKIVLLLDSVERLRGVGDSEDIAKVFKSVETIFAGHADKLRFPPLYLVCTIPPYLPILSGGLSALYSGGRIYMLPSVHVYENRPEDGDEPVPSETGLQAMMKIVDKRFPDWRIFFTGEQLQRLAANSGGDLRDFFRMIGLRVTEALYEDRLPLPDAVLASAESALRNDMP